MRGEIQTPAGPDGQGTLQGDDGAVYRYSASQVRGRAVLKAGDVVDFVALGSEARDIYVPAMTSAPRPPPPTARSATQAAAAAKAQAVPADNPVSYLARNLTRNYFRFTGRARRAEYWSYTLLWLLLLTACMIADGFLSALLLGAATAGEPEFAPLLSGILFVYSIIPGIAITVRRLHDQDMSGWLWLINFVPYIGPLILFILMFFDSRREANKHGVSPKYGAMQTADIFA
jgi:uncharacterized membrane protein YhaH (DUF805 family)